MGSVDVLCCVSVSARNDARFRDLTTSPVARCGGGDGVFGKRWNSSRFILLSCGSDVCNGDRDDDLSIVRDVTVRSLFGVMFFLGWPKVLPSQKGQPLQSLKA